MVSEVRGKCLRIKQQSVMVYLQIMRKYGTFESERRRVECQYCGIDSYLCFLVHAQCIERVVRASRGWDFVGRRGDLMRYW